MGNAKLYYYPDGSAGKLEVVNLGGPLTELSWRPARNRVSAVSYAGSMSSQNMGGSVYVRVVLERFTGLTAAGKKLAADLESLMAHLGAGNAVAVTADSDNDWAAYASGSLAQGDTRVPTGGQFLSWASGTVAGGERVMVHGGWPTSRRESIEFSSLNSTNEITLARGLRYSYPDGPVLVHHRDFWVGLRLPQDQLGQHIVVGANRRSYTLDMELFMDWGAVASWAPQDEGFNDDDDVGGRTFDSPTRPSTGGGGAVDGGPGPWSRGGVDLSGWEDFDPADVTVLGSGS